MTGSYLIDDKEIFQLIDTNVINEINYNPELSDNSVHPDIYVVICDDYSKMLCVSASDVSHTLDENGILA